MDGLVFWCSSKAHTTKYSHHRIRCQRYDLSCHKRQHRSRRKKEQQMNILYRCRNRKIRKINYSKSLRDICPADIVSIFSISSDKITSIILYAKYIWLMLMLMMMATERAKGKLFFLFLFSWKIKQMMEIGLNGRKREPKGRNCRKQIVPIITDTKKKTKNINKKKNHKSRCRYVNRLIIKWLF